MLPTIIIPAYQPDQNLLALINNITNSINNHIIIINDGSSDDKKIIFDNLKKYHNIDILEHQTNLGKGAALKTAFRYFLEQDKFRHSPGVITADADGQHLVEDLSNINNIFLDNHNSLILGVRKFQENIPIKSKIGNEVTKKVFKFLIGKKISDTQTGLRAIPREFLKDLVIIKSNRYEFELDMLILAIKNNINIIEEYISTVYIENNKGSHFNPIIDSAKVYFVFFRFIAVSLSSAIIDYLIFIILFNIFGYIFLAESSARIISASFNFLLNKKHVFNSSKSISKEALSYFSLALCLLFCSYYLLIFFINIININIYVAKILSMSLLFIISFIVQHLFIFSNKQASK